MRLHNNKSLFVDAVKFTSDQMRIPAIYVEKDYWVTFVLYTIFHHLIGEDIIFKGGTALAKCFNMIDRFSEDIDLVVLRREGESDSKMTTKIKKIGAVVSAVLPEIAIEGLTQKRGMNRKTAHLYNKQFSAYYGQIRDVIVVESTWLGYYEPYTTRELTSFVGKMMIANQQADLAQTYDLLPFEVRVLEPIRTLCEKIMSLVRFSYGIDPINNLKQKIRHTYDLHQLLQQPEYAQFLQSTAFDKMLLKVAHDDIASFRNNNQWLAFHAKDALIFQQTAHIWNEIRDVYNDEFRNLVYGEFPHDAEILETLLTIKKRLSLIDWTITVGQKNQ
jgi:hypothetical protein